MPDALSHVSTRRTPQAEQADPRQVPNSAGGWGFTVSRDARLHRFLTIGVEGGSYYATEQALTRENAQVVLDWARNDAAGLVSRAVGVSQAGRAPRNNPALFALAAASGLGNDAGRKAALDALPLVARTGTHLFTFAGYAEQFRGWGRGLRRAIGDWYLGKDPDQLAHQVLKYRNREGWMHQHLLQLAHPAHRPLLAWIAETPEFAASNRTGTRHSSTVPVPTWSHDALPHLVQAFEAAQALGREPESKLPPKAKAAAYASLIGVTPSLSWEMLPDEALANPGVWEALIAAGMPQTALMRQLPRLTRLGVLTQMSPVTAVVAAQLADRERLIAARVHPVNILVALRTYAGGRSVRGSTTWTPVPAITDALDAAFYAAYAAVEPAGKRTMLALDVSGSMTQPAAGLPVSCREATAALALVTASTEPQTLVTGFTSGSYPSRWSGMLGNRYGAGITPLNISPRQRLDDAIRTVSGLDFGGTDCALPMLWAAQNGIKIDTFQVYTDNETWAGDIHPHQALEAYRQKTGIPARLAVVACTPTPFTIADPEDPLTLDVSGLDSAVPGLLADFSRGDI
jgi:60 kDa SS-A/Ro ribonucleoprotein